MGSSWVEAFDAQRLRRLRLERRLTQIDLAVAPRQSEMRAKESTPSALEAAKRIDTLKVVVSNYEKEKDGRHPRGPVLLALAEQAAADDDLPLQPKPARIRQADEPETPAEVALRERLQDQVLQRRAGE